MYLIARGVACKSIMALWHERPFSRPRRSRREVAPSRRMLGALAVKPVLLEHVIVDSALAVEGAEPIVEGIIRIIVINAGTSVRHADLMRRINATGFIFEPKTTSASAVLLTTDLCASIRIDRWRALGREIEVLP